LLITWKLLQVFFDEYWIDLMRIRQTPDLFPIIRRAQAPSAKVIQAGLADELSIDIMPVLLSDGLRLFEPTGARPLSLERIQVLESPGGQTGLKYRFVKLALINHQYFLCAFCSTTQCKFSPLRTECAI